MASFMLIFLVIAFHIYTVSELQFFVGICLYISVQDR